MKKLITTALFIILITSMYGQTTFTIDGINYTTNGTSTVEVVSNIYYDEWGWPFSYYTGDIFIPYSVIFNDITYTVTSIGDGAFGGCYSLTSINIPNSVTSIESYAFQGCISLTSITLPNSITSIEFSVFSGCSGLTSITIPNSITSIGDGAFGGCSSLTSITIPNSVTSIGGSAFWGCSNLTTIYTNSVTPIDLTLSQNIFDEVSLVSIKKC